MTRTSRSVARGFTLIELLLVVAILAIAVGLLVAGLQKVRESATGPYTSNRLRSIGIGLNGFAEQYLGATPPSYGQFKGKVGGFFFHLLPFIEQDDLYRKTPVGGIVDVNGTAPVKSYRAPMDNSHDGSGPRCSYACNGALFLESVPNGLLPVGMPETGGARFPASFNEKGSTNVIILVERYAATPAAGGRHNWNTNTPTGVLSTTINGLNDPRPLPPVQFGVPHTAITPATDLTAHAFTPSGCRVAVADASTRLLTASINNAIPGGNGGRVFQWACTPGMAGPPPEGW